MTHLINSPANLVLQTTPGIRVLQAIKAALQICTQTRSTDLTRGIGRILQATSEDASICNMYKQPKLFNRSCINSSSDPLHRLGQWFVLQLCLTNLFCRFVPYFITTRTIISMSNMNMFCGEARSRSAKSIKVITLWLG